MKVNSGNTTKGAKRYNAKLSEDAVMEIRLNRRGLSVKNLAVQHGVSTSNIYQIIRGEAWGWTEAP